MSPRKRALLIQPPLEDFYTTPIRLYPLGLLYGAAVCESAGWEVKILDCLTPLRKKEIQLPSKFSYLRPYLSHPHFFRRYYRFGLSLEKIIKEVKDFSPDLIGLGCSFTAYYRSAAEVAEEIRRHWGRTIIAGGNHASCFPAEIISRTPAIEAVLGGEAEKTLPGWLREKFGDGEGRFCSPKITGGRKEEITQEATIDWKEIIPAHHLLNPNLYRIGQKNYASLQASRGCPFNCSFCNIHVVFGSAHNYRPVSSLLNEMLHLAENHRVRIFNFEDDNLAFHRVWFEEFLSAVKAEKRLQGAELLAMNGLSYDSLNEKLLELMKEAGFRRLDLSFVSGNPQTRKRLRRPKLRGSDHFWQVVKIAKKLGFFITVYLILGLPGQTEEEVKDTAARLWENNVLIGPSVFYLAPRSEIYETWSIPEEVKNDWDMYRSTAFALETPELSRQKLIDLFLYLREGNLTRRERIYSSKETDLS